MIPSPVCVGMVNIPGPAEQAPRGTA